VTRPLTYRDLDVWQSAIGLVEACYRSTAEFPRAELYGLTSQLRRAACSIPSNLAEGYCRRKTKPYANHVSIALGSHGELETCIEVATRLGYMSVDENASLMHKCDSVGRLLNGLFNALERKLQSEASV
jgi:four helix bundle protein